MKKFFLFVLFGPLVPLPARAVTVTSTPNAYMVENTSGTSPAGAVCYDFITNPTCSTSLPGFTASSPTFSGATTFSSTVTFNGPISAGGSFGTTGQALTSNVTSAPSWSSVTSPSSTTTWTAQQNFSGTQASTFTALNIGTSLTFAGTALVKIMQVQAYKVTAASTTTTTSFVPTNSTGTITPTSVSSKVLIIACNNLQQATAGKISYVTLERAGTELSGTSVGFNQIISAAGGELIAPFCIVYEDSPASTSNLGYAVYIKTDSGGSAVLNTLSGAGLLYLIELL